MVDEAVERNPFDNVRSDVVAEPPYAGCVHASYDWRAEVKNPASLLNQDSLTDDEAMVFACPLLPV